MKFTIEITELDNAAFHSEEFYDQMEDEVARIVRRVADRLESGDESGVCHDINGNRVGTWGFKKD